MNHNQSQPVLLGVLKSHSSKRSVAAFWMAARYSSSSCYMLPFPCFAIEICRVGSCEDPSVRAWRAIQCTFYLSPLALPGFFRHSLRAFKNIPE